MVTCALTLVIVAASKLSLLERSGFGYTSTMRSMAGFMQKFVFGMRLPGRKLWIRSAKKSKKVPLDNLPGAYGSSSRCHGPTFVALLKK